MVPLHRRVALLAVTLHRGRSVRPTADLQPIGAVLRLPESYQHSMTALKRAEAVRSKVSRGCRFMGSQRHRPQGHLKPPIYTGSSCFLEWNGHFKS